MITAKEASDRTSKSLHDHTPFLLHMAEIGIKEASGEGLRRYRLYSKEPANYTFMSMMRELGYCIAYDAPGAGVDNLYIITW